MHLVAVLPNIDALVVAEAHRAELPAKEPLLFLCWVEADFGGFEHRNRAENFFCLQSLPLRRLQMWN